MKLLNPVAYILLIVGGLNWGLVGLGWMVGEGADWNVVHMLVGSSMELEATIYILVGLSAVWSLLKNRKAMM